MICCAGPQKETCYSASLGGGRKPLPSTMYILDNRSSHPSALPTLKAQLRLPQIFCYVFEGIVSLEECFSPWDPRFNMLLVGSSSSCIPEMAI